MVKEAALSGLVIVYGASDDLMELEGAISDEIGACDGVTIRVDKDGLIPDFDILNKEDKTALRDYFARETTGQTIEQLWCAEEDYSWTFKTHIPHVTFEIVEDGSRYCRGIVFSLTDVK